MESGLPLEGLRVLELGYGIAAPVAARNLAQFGADVIRVESSHHPDSLRVGGAGWIPASVDRAVRRDTMPALNFSSAEKRSIGLDIDTRRGRAVFERLVAGSDVLITNMSEGALAHLDLGEESMRALRPDLVYVSMTAFGKSGPYHGYRTWGQNLSAMSGIDHLIGWPDRDPVQLGIAYPDFVSAHAVTVAVLAALQRRDDTGQGANIELAQLPMALGCLGPSIIEAQLGHEPAACGNRAADFAPQGVYPARGVERWVAVSVVDDEMWASLVRVPGLESLGAEPMFATVDARLAHEDELDEVLATWTAVRTDWEAAAELQAFGVAAAPVLDAWDLVADQQLAARDFFHALPHARFARDLVFGQAVRLSETPPRAEWAAPAFGADSRAVLRDVAGLDDGAIDELARDGVVEEMTSVDVVFERPYVHWIGKVMRQLPWGSATFDPAAEMMQRLDAGDGNGDGHEGGAGR